MRTEVHTSLAELSVLAPQWDAMVIEQGRPRSAPAWVGAWYSCVMPSNSRIRVISAWEGPTLLAVLPLSVRRNRLGLIRYEQAGVGTLTKIEPIIREGSERRAISVVARAVPSLRPLPDIVHFECVGAEYRQLMDEIVACWPGPEPETHAKYSEAPFIDFRDEGMSGWIGRRSPRFHRELLRKDRRLAEADAKGSVYTDAADIVPRLQRIARQYAAVKEARGGDGIQFDGSVLAMIECALRDVGGRNRVALAVREGPNEELIAFDLALGAGEVVTGWVCGYDQAWRRFSPGSLTHYVQIANAAEASRCRIFDMGPGSEGYKDKWSDGASDLLEWTMFRRGVWPIHSPAQLFSKQQRDIAVEVAQRLRRRLGRRETGE